MQFYFAFATGVRTPVETRTNRTDFSTWKRVEEFFLDEWKMPAVKREAGALRRVLALRPWSYTAYNGVGVRICTRLRSFILWWRGLDGKRPRFYGEPRHLTGLPPSSNEIFRPGSHRQPPGNVFYRVATSRLMLESFKQFLATSFPRRIFSRKILHPQSLSNIFSNSFPTFYTTSFPI